MAGQVEAYEDQDDDDDQVGQSMRSNLMKSFWDLSRAGQVTCFMFQVIYSSGCSPATRRPLDVGHSRKPADLALGQRSGRPSGWPISYHYPGHYGRQTRSTRNTFRPSRAVWPAVARPFGRPDLFKKVDNNHRA